MEEHLSTHRDPLSILKSLKYHKYSFKTCERMYPICLKAFYDGPTHIRIQFYLACIIGTHNQWHVHIPSLKVKLK